MASAKDLMDGWTVPELREQIKEALKKRDPNLKISLSKINKPELMELAVRYGVSAKPKVKGVATPAASGATSIVGGSVTAGKAEQIAALAAKIAMLQNGGEVTSGVTASVSAVATGGKSAEDPVYGGWNCDYLRTFLKEKGVSGYSKLNKAQLIAQARTHGLQPNPPKAKSVKV